MIKNNNVSPYVISVDWVSIFCCIKLETKFYYNTKYLITLERATNVFNKVYVIKNLLGEDLATYATDAKNIIDKDKGVLKISNRLLYVNENLKEFINIFLSELGLQFLSFTRFDICCDFYHFNNFRSCENFIKDFNAGRILKVFNVVYKSIGKRQGLNNVHSYIAFGSASSPISSKLYNKSLEFKEKVQKNYIIDIWKKHKSFYNYESEVFKDVWRLEFTLRCGQKQFFNDLNESFHLHSLDALDKVPYLFSFCFNKYFDMVYKGGQQRLDRMKPLSLLDFNDLDRVYKITHFEKVPGKKDAVRAIKIFSKKLEDHYQELRNYNYSDAIEFKNLNDKVIEFYGLEDWAEKNKIGFDNSCFVDRNDKLKSEYLEQID